VKRIFISGGAGFVGSHLVARFLQNSEILRIVIFDNFSSGRKEHLAESLSDPRLRIVTGDLKDAAVVRREMVGCDTVVHLAANPDIARAVTEPDIDFREGTCLTQNILEAMRINKVETIVYTSGSGVYGENSEIAFAENYGPCLPISTYGASKLASEALISAYCHMFNLKGRVFRFANVVGPRQTHGVGYDFIRRLASDPTRLRILGDGWQSKSYIYVDDILEAIFLSTARSTEPFTFFNVATDDYLTVRAIAELALAVAGLDPESVALEFTGGDRGWRGDVPVVRFDCSKIKALGWRSQRSSSQAMRDAMQSMQNEILIR
jgi:UDP-glucose 4-epimerase